MNAEALIGKTLGTCTLQELIGQGGMGAVYLAQQTRPRRQVAVKVLLPAQPLTANQRAGFLERFRRETDAAASLVHPNIIPIHEYGEGEGLAYLVMPYVSGGTLRDELEYEGLLPLARALNYLEQLAAALDCAHESGVIHRDVKPANVMKTPEGRLLLSDFGLVKIIADGEQARITGIGMPVGTPDYMAPEQAMGAEVDARADVYGLGVVLYQMLTGVTPFRGDLPMQIAMQHLHMPPPPLRSMRPDLPMEAELAVLRALSKRPDERYARAMDLAIEFRAALERAGVQLDNAGAAVSDTGDDGRSFKKRGLFDPMWRPGTEESGKSLDARSTDLRAKSSFTIPTLSGFMPPSVAAQEASPQTSANLSSFSMRKHTPLPSTGQGGNSSLSPKSTRTLFSAFAPSEPAPSEAPQQTRTSLFQKSRMQAFSDQQEEGMSSPLAAPPPAAASSSQQMPDWHNAMQQSGFEEGQGQSTSKVAAFEDAWRPGPKGGGLPAITRELNQGPTNPMNGQTGTMPATGNTSSLLVPSNMDQSGTTTAMKLTQSVKVVQVPVAGQPGRYMTGFLPVGEQLPPAEPEAPLSFQEKLKQNGLAVIAVAAVLLLLFGSGIFILPHLMPQQQQASKQNGSTPTPNATAIQQLQATATAQADIILTDPLNELINNWPVKNKDGVMTGFKDGAYHMAVTSPKASAVALYPNRTFGKQLGYTLTMWEIKGDDGNLFNWYGMIVREKTVNGNPIFYVFQITPKIQQYSFVRYDGNAKVEDKYVEKIWSQHFGPEYHAGQGDKHKNTVKIAINGDKFTFIVNGKEVGRAQNGQIGDGGVGMVVNRNGAEVAFSDFVLTNH